MSGSELLQFGFYHTMIEKSLHISRTSKSDVVASIIRMVVGVASYAQVGSKVVPRPAPQQHDKKPGVFVNIMLILPFPNVSRYIK